MVTEALQNLTESVDHRVRLLLPFFLERNECFKAEQVLCKLNQVVHKDHESSKSWRCWEKPATIPFLYHDETLPSVKSFLFGTGRGSCVYLRVPDETANFWFKNNGYFAKKGEIAQLDKTGRPIRFEVSLAAPGIELFLSPHGAGVFSVTFAPKHTDGTHYLQELNYRLSQLREFTAYSFCLPHSEKDPSPPHAPNADFTERLGHAGGAFTLEEWLKFLLEPLNTLKFERLQEQFSVYSVTRFGVSADFTDAKVQAALQPYLAAVVHVEEYHHAGSLEICAQKLNPHHWAAVGSLGAAQLVSDQNDPPHDFNEQRVTISLHKYFIPYLVSMMQRIVLQSILMDAQKILVSQCLNTPDESGHLLESLRKLNQNTLMFTVNGWFTEISSREVLNQYYALAQRGLRVPDSFQTVQRALRDAELMDDDRFQSETLGKLEEQAKQAHVSASNMEELGKKAGLSVDNMQELVKKANKSAETVADVQSKLEWLEVFFVSYYATALVNYIGESNFLDAAYVHVSLLLIPLFSGLMAFRMLELGKQEKRRSTDQHSFLFMLILIFVYVVWLAVGMGLQWYKTGSPLPTHTSEPCCQQSAQLQNPATMPAED